MEARGSQMEGEEVEAGEGEAGGGVISESELVSWPGSLGLSALHVTRLWKDNGLPAQGTPLPDGSLLCYHQ